MIEEWIDERELGTRLGVSREALRDARLEMPADLTRVEKRAVQWSLEAVSLFTERVGLVDPNAKKTAPEPAAEAEVLTVISFPRADGYHHGRHHIKARRANGEEVMVRVLDSSKWRRTLRTNNEPMTFPAKKSDGHWWLPLKQPRFIGMF
jgi:ribosome biogenesis SPOUT family RNA methylase Rps3